MFSRLLVSARAGISRVIQRTFVSHALPKIGKVHIDATRVLSDINTATTIINRVKSEDSAYLKRQESVQQLLKRLKIDNKVTVSHLFATEKKQGSEIKASKLLPLPSSSLNSLLSARFLVGKSNKVEFGNMFQFIAQNKILPELISKIDPKDPKLEQLSLAIKEGDFESKIFSDPACDTYLLYLMKTEKITLLEGLDIYSYLIALMQFTEKQALREMDGDVKLDRYLSIERLVINNKLTRAGDSFIKETCDNFSKLNYKINSEDLTKFVLGLSPSEARLLRVPSRRLNPLYLSDDIESLTAILVKSVPFFQADGHAYCIPSIKVMNYFLQKMSHSPAKMYPMFGTLSEKSAEMLHENGFQPISIYSKHVKSNPEKVHEFRCGPFLVFLHDIFHAFGMTLIEPADRKLIFSELIKPLYEIVERQKLLGNSKDVKYVESLISELHDFNLSPSLEFADPKTRLYNYLGRIFNTVVYNNPFHPPVINEVLAIYENFLKKMGYELPPLHAAITQIVEHQYKLK